MTLTMFNKLYGHYKRDWGMEMRMTQANMTYEEVKQKQQEADDWF